MVSAFYWLAQHSYPSNLVDLGYALSMLARGVMPETRVVECRLALKRTPDQDSIESAFLALVRWMEERSLLYRVRKYPVSQFRVMEVVTPLKDS